MVKILHPEDEPLITECLKEFYKEISNAQVDFVENGEQAYDKFRKTNYDILVTDFHMPGLNGGDLIKKIRQSDNKIPIFTFNANADKENTEFDKAGLRKEIIASYEKPDFLGFIQGLKDYITRQETETNSK